MVHTHTEMQQPKCIGFIMDGNRRWAKERGLDTLEGHRKGHAVFKAVVRLVRDAGIPHAVFYAFSSENWQRSGREVQYLMGLFERVLSDLLEGTDEDKVRVRIIGDRTLFSGAIQTLMKQVEERSQSYTHTTIWVALSYGGRQEIVQAVNHAVALGVPVTESTFTELLWTADMPDPDLIVRTSGERRLSNFLPWQSVYSELHFINTYWPDFGKEEFHAMLEEYGARKRRKGK